MCNFCGPYAILVITFEASKLFLSSMNFSVVYLPVEIS